MSENVLNIQQVISLFSKAIKYCKVELSAVGQTIAKVKIQSAIVQADSLLLFVKLWMLIKYIFRKCAEDDTFFKIVRKDGP